MAAKPETATDTELLRTEYAIDALCGLAVAKQHKQDFPGAVATYSRALAHSAQAQGKGYAGTLAVANRLASLLYRLADALRDGGEPDRALDLERQLLALREAYWGAKHALALEAADNVAVSLNALGRHAEAVALAERTVHAARKTLARDDRDRILMINNLGGFYAGVERWPEAEKLYREAATDAARALGPDDDVTKAAQTNVRIAASRRQRRATRDD